MTCLGELGARLRKAVAAQPLTKTCRVFNTLQELRKPLKTLGLYVYISDVKSILCHKVFGFNTEIFFEVHPS